MYQLQQPPGRTTIINGKEYLFFSGYSYLGMGHVPEFMELVQIGIQKHGVLHPSSRVSNTQLELYASLEQHLSNLTGSEETVTFSSGYLAGKAVVDALVKDKRNCFIAPDTHPALQSEGIQLQRHWKKILVQTINESSDDNFVLLIDSVNPLKACINDFAFLSDLLPNKNLTCVIDDSHGIGYLGPAGQGICYFLPTLANVEFVFTYSLSKALHINGGAVSCSHRIARLLRQSPWYTGSTPIAPFAVYAFLHAEEIYKQQQQKLFQNIRSFMAYLQDVPGIISHPALPIFLLKKEFDQSVFDPHKIIISSFSYPDPNGIKTNRIVVNALHTNDDLQRVATLLQQLVL